MNWLGIILSWLRPRPNPTPKPGPVNPVPAAGLIAALNVERAKASRSPRLSESAALNASAIQWAKSMAATGVLTHGDFSGRMAAVMPDRAVAENIAEGQPTVADVVASWMNSPGHRANILGPYTEAGYGVAADASGRLFWVVDFAG